MRPERGHRSVSSASSSPPPLLLSDRRRNICKVYNSHKAALNSLSTHSRLSQTSQVSPATPNRRLLATPSYREIKTPAKTARQILVEDNGCEFGPIRARGSRGLLVGGEPEVLPGLHFPSPLNPCMAAGCYGNSGAPAGWSETDRG